MRWFIVQTIDAEPRRWIEDTCAGGKWTFDASRAKWWQSAAAAAAELEACDIDAAKLEIVELVSV